MRTLAPRPLLLALTLVLIVGAIFFIQLRLGTVDPGSARAVAEPPPPSGAQVGETTSARPGVSGSGKGDSRRNEDGAEQAVGEESSGERRSEDVAERVRRKGDEYQRAKEIVAPTGFLNTDAVSVRAARGEKVILLEFWTYSCYNCQNVQPYVNSWYEKYGDDGLLVIGVHRPEFEFEKDRASVEDAVRRAGIRYSVVLDNDSGTWNAYGNRYWPAWYLIDADGFIRYKHIGEGAYDETERKIRELLKEKDNS